jgi:hypothetical protein
MSGNETGSHADVTSDGFATTAWSLILAAGREQDGKPALERLCRKHWRPIYIFRAVPRPGRTRLLTARVHF